MAQIKGNHYESWEAYIEARFDPSLFIIDRLNAPGAAPRIRIGPRSTSNFARIMFFLPMEDCCKGYFYHPNSPHLQASNEAMLTSPLTLADYEFNDENLLHMDQQLKIPIEWGWTEKTTYYKGMLVKAELLFHNGTAWQSALLAKRHTRFDIVSPLASILMWPVVMIDKVIFPFLQKINKKYVTVNEVVIEPLLSTKSESN